MITPPSCEMRSQSNLCFQTRLVDAQLFKVHSVANVFCFIPDLRWLRKESLLASAMFAVEIKTKSDVLHSFSHYLTDALVNVHEIL